MDVSHIHPIPDLTNLFPYTYSLYFKLLSHDPLGFPVGFRISSAYEFLIPPFLVISLMYLAHLDFTI